MKLEGGGAVVEEGVVGVGGEPLGGETLPLFGEVEAAAAADKAAC